MPQFKMAEPIVFWKKGKHNVNLMKTEQLFSKMKEEAEDKDVFSDSTVRVFSK